MFTVSLSPLPPHSLALIPHQREVIVVSLFVYYALHFQGLGLGSEVKRFVCQCLYSRHDNIATI
jgi:hypothetical protein